MKPTSLRSYQGAYESARTWVPSVANIECVSKVPISLRRCSHLEVCHYAVVSSTPYGTRVSRKDHSDNLSLNVVWLILFGILTSPSHSPRFFLYFANSWEKHFDTSHFSMGGGGGVGITLLQSEFG